MAAFLLVIAGLIIVIAANANFKNQTGVNAPSRSAMKAIRRRARKQGMSTDEYMDGWIERKRRKQG